MSNLEHPRITEVGRLLAENDRLREALEIARDTISPHDYPALFARLNAALAKEAGK
jgi:hypothetical protein